MKAQLQKQNNQLDNLFEETILSKKNLDKPDAISSEVEDDKIVFLLENNLLSQIGKLESIGYEFKEEHKKQYYQKLYLSVINNPQETIRQYLNQGIELPNKFLTLCFLVDIQNNDNKGEFGVKKVIMSFIDKVKKGLQTDPVAKYKMEKLKDKDFINDIFDLWYISSIKHFEDIKKHVVNKKKFLWFYLNKSKSTMTKDIHNFTDNVLQKHIVNHHNYFEIPVTNTFFLQSLGPDKLVKVKDIIKMHDEVYNMLESSTSNMHVSTTMLWCRHIKMAEIELSDVVVAELDKQLKLYYEQQGNNIINSIENVKVSNNIVSDKLDKKTYSELPVEATKIVEQIKSITNELYSNTINDETKQSIEFLSQEKLEEVISKYMNIDKAYRHNLKNVQGKTAKELMLESLEIIKNSLELIEKDINEEKLKDLSIHTRYLKRSLKN